MARQLSAASMAVFDLLQKRKGEITASDGVEQLKTQGITIEPQQFNNLKQQWKKRQDNGHTNGNGHKPVVSPLTITEAIAFVKSHGNLAAAKEAVAAAKAKIERDEALVELFEEEVISLA